MKLLVYDHGHNLELALLLAKWGHTVGYHIPPTASFWDHVPGDGFEKDGLEKVSNFWDALNRADKTFFFGASSQFDGDLVDWLRASGKPIWGAGSAERLEHDRWYSKQVQRKEGLPIQGVARIVGVPALLNHLQNKMVKDKIVKVSRYRDIETFKHDDWPTTQAQYVGKRLTKYGTDSSIEFLVEDTLKSDLEVGSDDVIVNSTPAGLRGYGYEAKDASYLGRFGVPAHAMPTVLDQTFNALQPVLRAARASTFFSTEVRGGRLIDVTARTPYPPTPAIMLAYRNLADVLVGVDAELKLQQPYAGSIVLKSGWSKDHPTKVDFPPQKRMFYKWLNAYRQDDATWIVPGGDEIIGYACYAGQSPKAVVEGLRTLVNEVKAKELYADEASLDDLLKTIEKGKASGIQF